MVPLRDIQKKLSAEMAAHAAAAGSAAAPDDDEVAVKAAVQAYSKPARAAAARTAGGRDAWKAMPWADRLAALRQHELGGGGGGGGGDDGAAQGAAVDPRSVDAVHPPFDAWDADSVTAWLAAFERSCEAAECDFTTAGVCDANHFDWLDALANDPLCPVLSGTAPDAFEQLVQPGGAPDALEALLADFLHRAQAYSSRTMFSQEAAAAWASSWAKSMEGASFYTSGASRDSWSPVTNATFDRAFVACLGGKVAFLVIEDED